MPTSTGALSPAAFIAKWSRAQLSERAASQEHFLDLCRILGQPSPAEHDSTGAEYTFEKSIAINAPASRGSQGRRGNFRGFVDVCWKDKFAWEYKSKDKYNSLDDAYRQLQQYREALDNPPLLIVCDIAHTEIHTNFTGTAKQKHVIDLDHLTDADNLAKLRRVFTDPYSFKPQLTLEQITNDVAQQFGKLAQSIESRGHPPHNIAHFLMKCMFCLFAEDVQLLPKELFNKTLSHWHREPKKLTPILNDLFARMRTGGAFGSDKIEWFNGGLFDDKPAIELNESEIGVLLIAAGRDWSQVEPSIFGTLFERSLDPAKRSQIGAHYTSTADILLVVEPVVLAPLRKQWADIRQKCESLIEKRADATRRKQTGQSRKNEKSPQALTRDIEKLLLDFDHHLSTLRILDPACGSGNFLYVCLRQLLNLEKEIFNFGAQPDVGVTILPRIRPTQLHGIEINPFAAELAQVVIWIGYLQWMRDNGFAAPRDPILDSLNTIQCRDAILHFSPALPETPGSAGGSSPTPVPPQPPAEPGAERRTATPADWPPADFIIGNPPFLGSKLFRKSGLPDDYVQAMYDAYEIPNTSDLCCYWLERARFYVETAKKYGGKNFGSVPFGKGIFGGGPASVRVGLLATQGIRGTDNRTVLQRIKKIGDIFFAESDRDWVLDGAAVHVSMIGFDDGSQTERTLDGKPARQINVNLTDDQDTTLAKRLAENRGLGFVGACKKGKFEITVQQARQMIAIGGNPNGRSNAEVLVPWYNGIDVLQRYLGDWIIDFGVHEDISVAGSYEQPFEYVRRYVKPERDKVRNPAEKRRWWMLARPAPDYRKAVCGLQRFVVVSQVAKHRVFCWLETANRPSHALTIFARADDYFMGVLSSSPHVIWSLRMGTQLEDRPRYTPTTCFETFALPWSPGAEPNKGDKHFPLWQRIGDAAKQLNEQREQWLNPPQWIEPLARSVDALDDFADVPAEARPLIRQSAIMALAAKDARLKKRTLTNLYNQRPTWLKIAHEQLDRAVLAAYAATDPEGDWAESWAGAWTDSGAGQPLPADHPQTQSRAEVEQRVLANLLRLNHTRSHPRPRK